MKRQQIDEQKKTEEEIKPKLIATKYLLIGTVLVIAIALINVFLDFIKGSRENIQIP